MPCVQSQDTLLTSPSVHQKDVALHEKILRHFDLSSQYGPCIGITRLSRWKRADTLGLDPPVEVLAVLMREENKGTSQGCGKIAYIDALGGGKVGIVE
jgi:DNA polymerase delta subunit 4